MTFSFSAVLWDMDGTLVDTEPYWMAAETPLVEKFGGTWSHEQALAVVGLGLEDAARILQSAGVRMGVHDIIDHLTEDVMRQLLAKPNASPSPGCDGSKLSSASSTTPRASRCIAVMRPSTTLGQASVATN